jgi:hypothetical protein
MNHLNDLRKRLQRNQEALLRKLPRAQHFFSQTPQASPYKRHDLEILKILKQLSETLSRK